MKKLVLYGCGYPVITNLIEYKNNEKPEWEIIGFLDDSKYGQIDKFLGYPVLGNEQMISMYVEQGCYFFNNVASSSNNMEIVYNKLKKYDAKLATFLLSEPELFHADPGDIGEGTIIAPKVLVDPLTKIGKNVIVRQNAIVAHDTRIGDFTFIGPGAYLLGGASVGSRCYIGAGAMIKNDVRVGDNCTIGMGAIIQRDVPDNTTVALIKSPFQQFKS